MQKWVIIAVIEASLLCAGVVVDAVTPFAPVWVWAFTGGGLFVVAVLLASEPVWHRVASFSTRLIGIGSHTDDPDAQAFNALVPLIEQVIRFKEQPGDPSAMPSGIDMEKAWRLDAELHKLDIPHTDLKPDDNRIVQAAILAGLLSCANRSDIKGARSLFQRTGDGFLCDWEPQY